MSLSIGIVGLPNVGKSTLFQALTKKSVLIANYPFATIDPSVGVVPVPDKRVEKLAALSHSAKIIPAVVEFVDIAGLVRGAAQGAGLGNQFLSHIREVDAIAEVVRIFDDADVVHVEEAVDPLRDIEVIDLELALTDLQTVKHRLAGIQKEVKRGEKTARAENNLLERIAANLEEGVPLRTLSLSEEEREMVRSLHLLTAKPIIYVLNRKNSGYNLDELADHRWRRLQAFLEDSGASWVILDAAVENELRDVAVDDALAFRQEFGVTDSGLDVLIRKSYEILNLVSFFTIGEDETRAWTIRRNTTAKNAGAAIHTDFRDKFIKAEVVYCDDLLNAGSYAKAREQGLVRTEGKEYSVKDGDVIEFKI